MAASAVLGLLTAGQQDAEQHQVLIVAAGVPPGVVLTQGLLNTERLTLLFLQGVVAGYKLNYQQILKFIYQSYTLMGAEKEKKIDAKFKNEKCCVTPDGVVVVVVAVDWAAADTGLGPTGALTQGLLITCTVQHSTVQYSKVQGLLLTNAGVQGAGTIISSPGPGHTLCLIL